MDSKKSGPMEGCGESPMLRSERRGLMCVCVYNNIKVFQRRFKEFGVMTRRKISLNFIRR